MSKLFALLALVTVAALGWWAGAHLNQRAVDVLIGMGFMLATTSIPLALMTMYARQNTPQRTAAPHSVSTPTAPPKLLQRPTAPTTGLALRVPQYRVVEPTTAITVRENEVQIYGD